MMVDMGGKPGAVRFLWPVLKLCLVLLGFVLIFVGLGGDQWQPIGDLSLRETVYAILLFQLAFLMSAARMNGCLRGFDITVGVAATLRIYYQSIFYFFFLPTGVGMEIARFAKIKATNPRVSSSLLATAVVADRGFGVFSSAVVAGLLLPFVNFVGRTPAVRVDMALVFAAVLAILASLLAWRFLPRLRRYFYDIASHLITKWHLVLTLMLWSLSINLVMGGSLYFAGQASGIEIGLKEVVFGLCVSNFALLVPISFAGLSGVEVASAMIFSILGLALPEAVTIAFAGYLLKLMGAVQGGSWELWHSIRQLLRARE